MKNHWTQIDRDTHRFGVLTLKRYARGWRVEFHPLRVVTVGHGNTLYGAKASVEHHYPECHRQWRVFVFRAYVDGFHTRSVQ